MKEDKSIWVSTIVATSFSCPVLLALIIMNLDESYMQQALKLAKKGRHTVSPNPMVGCIIVKNGYVIGTGFHRYAGGPHAEIIALKEAGEHALGASVYVTLEPCCHVGRTPPCVDALIAAKVKNVFIACQDINPLVSGQGISTLIKAGITVTVGLLEKHARQLNEIFFHYLSTKKPFVIAKWAMSLDGKTIVNDTDDKKITSRKAQMHMHRLRQQVDAIIVGANTIRQDDPKLTVRLSKHPSKTKQPKRVVVLSKGKLSLNQQIFSPELPGETWIATTEAIDPVWRKTIATRAQVLLLPANHSSQVDLYELLTALGKRGITSVLVEGGETLHQSFFAERLVNRVSIYIAPVIIAHYQNKQRIMQHKTQALGTDWNFTSEFIDYV